MPRNVVHAVRGVTKAKIGVKKLRRRTQSSGLSQHQQELLGADLDEHYEVVRSRRQMEDEVKGVYEPEGSPVYDFIGAIEENDIDKVVELAEAGASVNGRLHHEEFPGQTALVWATRLGKLPVARALIDLGADPFIPDDKSRDAWYYACFGRNIAEGDHKMFMAVFLEQWAIDEKVMLMAMHSPHGAVKRVALDALPVEVLSRDSKNFCKLRFTNLSALDCQCETTRLTWPDGSKSPLRLTAFQKMVETESVDAVAHPAVMALLWWKWDNFGRTCFYIDVAFYLLTLISISGVSIIYSELDWPESVRKRWMIFMLVSNGMMLVQEVYLAFVVVRAEKRLQSLFGRPLHAFISCTLAFICYGTMQLDDMNGGEGTSGQTIAEDVLAAAVIFTWTRMLYFIQKMRGFGSFCIILVEMIKRDVTKFVLLLAGILPGFLLSIHMLMQSSCREEFEDDSPGKRWLAYTTLLTNMLFMILGVVSWDGPIYDCMDNIPIVICLLLFLLMTAIVLLNLMIAMFSDTYERIQTQAVHQWALNFAQYIRRKELFMESLASWPDRRTHLNRSSPGWSLERQGPHDSFFIPRLRGDGDERPEEYILEQLEAMWDDLRKRQETMEAQLRPLGSKASPKQVVVDAIKKQIVTTGEEVVGSETLTAWE